MHTPHIEGFCLLPMRDPGRCRQDRRPHHSPSPQLHISVLSNAATTSACILVTAWCDGNIATGKNVCNLSICVQQFHYAAQGLGRTVPVLQHAAARKHLDTAGAAGRR